MPTLEQVITDDAAYCRDVSITVCRSLGTVAIEDITREQSDIFLQGRDGLNFIDRLDTLVDVAPEVIVMDVIKHLAKPYCDCLWN